jgi:hypothetical protein
MYRIIYSYGINGKPKMVISEEMTHKRALGTIKLFKSQTRFRSFKLVSA